MALDHAPRLDRVASGLGHLLALLIEDQAEAHHVAVRRGHVEQRGDRQQRVEPSSRLVLRLADEVGGIALLEALLVLEGKVVLCERHRSGVEPDVDHLRHAPHPQAALLALALAVAGKLDFVHERAVVIAQGTPA